MAELPSGYVPSFQGFGAENPRWQGNDASYKAKHKRIARQRGSAKQYQCADCPRQARQWSHTHGTDDGNPDNYQPRCVSCHMVYDKRTNFVPNTQLKGQGNSTGLAFHPGSQHVKAKLTEQKVREIRVLLSTGANTHAEIGGMFGVSSTAISHISRGTTWGWLK